MQAHTHVDILVEDLPASRRSLRVAFVTETYPPEVNGVATTTAKFVEGLHQRQHDIQLVRPRQVEPGRQVLEDHYATFDQVLTRGLPIPRYPHLRMGLPSRRALTRLWSLQRPDVVHIATEGPLGWSALQAARHLKLPVTSDFRTNFHAYSRHYGVGWLQRPIMAYLRKFHNHTSCTMVPTEVLMRELQAAGFERLAVVPRGVDTERFSPSRRSEALRAAWGAGLDDLVVGYVGRLAAEKNLGLLQAAFASIAEVHPRARLVLVGDGPQRAALQAALPQAVFAGQRGGMDLAAHYASMDLFLFPSQTETFGNVTTEALASGLAVVAFRHAAAGSLIVHGHNGMLAACEDSAAFVRAALLVSQQPQRRQQLGERARATALALGWAGVVSRFEDLLLAACQAPPSQALSGLARPAPRLAA